MISGLAPSEVDVVAGCCVVDVVDSTGALFSVSVIKSSIVLDVCCFRAASDDLLSVESASVVDGGVDWPPPFNWLLRIVLIWLKFFTRSPVIFTASATVEGAILYSPFPLVDCSSISSIIFRFFSRFSTFDCALLVFGIFSG